MQFHTIGQQQPITQQSKPLVLREGQVFHGSIKQLFPDQMAEVQVGGNKLIAKLETPLKAGDSHYFQVTNTNGQVELKVVTGPMAQGTPAQQMTQLMDSMNLPKSAEMRQVLSHFIQHNLPISKDQLIQAEAWLKAIPDQTSKEIALQAISRMIDLKMPFTNDVFQALMNGSKPTGMAASIQSFLQNIMQDTQMNSTLKNSLMQQLQTIQQPLQQQVGGNVLALAVNTLLDGNATMSNKLEALTFLKQTGVLAHNATISNLTPTLSANNGMAQALQQLASNTPTNVNQSLALIQTMVQEDSTLTNGQKNELHSMLERFAQTNKTDASIAQFTKQFGEQLLKFHASNQLSNPPATNGNGMTSKEQMLALLNNNQAPAQTLQQVVQTASSSTSPFIQNLSTNAEQALQVTMDSKQMEQAVKTVLRSLGLNYEAQIGSGKGEQIETAAQSLKPQIMSLLNEPQISPQVRDSAETLLARINGMQLLSSDNGHQHQIVMQVPLQFLGKQMEATLHWNGRMKEDGKIDANYARILFYLQMESLQETVIDMQVQNRIVSITVFNDNTNLQPLANGLKDVLSIGLEEKGYQLSGVQLKTFEQPKIEATKNVKSASETARSGVDIRI